MARLLGITRFWNFISDWIESRVHLRPEKDNALDLGSSDYQWRRVYVGPGTVGAPAITLAGDTDTGIYQSSANSLDFSAGGYGKLRVTSASIPASGAGLSVGWNRSGGNAEVNFYNLYNNPGYGYIFSIKTGASTYTDLFLLQGNGEVVPGSNETQSLGTDAREWKDVWALDTAINHSDLRDKTDLGDSLGIEFIRLLRPRSWRWNTELVKGKRRHNGLVAQDVLAALTTLGVSTLDFAGYVYSPNTQKHYLRLGEFIGPIVKAIQDLDQRLTTLERGQGGIDGRP